MGVQVPSRVHAEVPQEIAVWTNPAALRRMSNANCAISSATNSGRGATSFRRRTGRRDDPRLHQEPRIGRQAVGPDATEARILKSPIPCPSIPHNRLWRFPFKPPALLGVIGSPRHAPTYRPAPTSNTDNTKRSPRRTASLTRIALMDSNEDRFEVFHAQP